jgi:hypothetical protein
VHFQGTTAATAAGTSVFFFSGMDVIEDKLPGYGLDLLIPRAPRHSRLLSALSVFAQSLQLLLQDLLLLLQLQQCLRKKLHLLASITQNSIERRW